MTKEEFSRIRQLAGMTQAELAAFLRVVLRTVQKWELGERPVPGPVTVLMEQLRETHKRARR